MATAEDLYFDIYTEISDRGDYLQSGSHVRYSLPDFLVGAAVASILGAFAEGFFSSLGEKSSRATVEKVRSLFRKAKNERNHDASVEALELTFPVYRSGTLPLAVLFDRVPLSGQSYTTGDVGRATPGKFGSST